MMGALSAAVLRALLIRLYTPTHCAGVPHSVYTPRSSSLSYSLVEKDPLARIRTRTPLRTLRNHGHRRGIRSPNGPCTNLAVAVITPSICDMRSGHTTTVITPATLVHEAAAGC